MKADSLDGFMNAMDLGDPDQQITGPHLRIRMTLSNGLVKKTDDWRQRD